MGEKEAGGTKKSATQKERIRVRKINNGLTTNTKSEMEGRQTKGKTQKIRRERKKKDAAPAAPIVFRQASRHTFAMRSLSANGNKALLYRA